MKKTALLIMIITLLSKVIGFSRELFFSYFYGATDVTDAYIIAITIPIVIMSFLTQSIASIYIPLFNRVEKEEGTQEANNFTNNLTNISLGLATVIVIVSILFTEPIVKLFASGFQGSTLKLAIDFTRISIFSVYFIFLSSLYCSYLQLKNSFIVPSLVGIPHSIVLMISLYLSIRVHIILLPIGILLASIAEFLLIIPTLRKKEYKYRFLIKLQDDKIKKMAQLSIPVMMGLSVQQINVLVDKTIASRIIEGGIAVLTYARYLEDFLIALFVFSLTTVIFPNISKLAVQKDLTNIKRLLGESITLVSLIMVPSTVGFMIFSTPIVKMVYMRGAFDNTALNLTSAALFYYSIGTIGSSLRVVMTKFFFSLDDTRTPNVTAAIALMINVILNIILSKYMGIGGLALATSIATNISTLIMFISFRKKIGPFGLKKISYNFIKIVCASLIMGLIAKLAYIYLTNYLNLNASLLLAIALGVISYFIILSVVKIDDVDEFVSMFKKIWKKRTMFKN